MTIASGSYVLEMTTQEGRTAMVIFPPGRQSLDDIQYMLGGSDERSNCHILNRVLAAPSGDVKCFLQKL
jgi:hypothetical protein